jgi:hypothetical protein
MLFLFLFYRVYYAHFFNYDGHANKNKLEIRQEKGVK